MRARVDNLGRRARLLTLGAALVACGVLGLAGWLAGCARNDPFDPDSVPNAPPVARIFVAPNDSGGILNPTSYYQRTFAWSGTDVDGWVQEYYVSIRTEADVPAPWDTTQRTDTTMSFEPDNEGNAEAVIIVVCRDDRGALSDTVRQNIPMRNFPPAVNFQSDFDPRSNMQREIDTSGAEPDTTLWNWGPSSFRFFAFDLDGAATMDPFYRYTLVDGDPATTWDHDDPAADPELGWVRVPFTGLDDIKEFQIFIERAAPGQRTLTVSVADEGAADARFTYSWEVRAPSGPMLWVVDNTPSFGKQFWTEAFESHLGPDGWDTYEFLYGFPDNPGTLLATFRLFDAVVWSGGTTSNMLIASTKTGGVVDQYVTPAGSQPRGRFFLATPNLVGNNSDLTPAFRQNTLFVQSATDPLDQLDDMDGSLAEPQVAGLPTMECVNRFSRSWGLLALGGADTEALYRLEQCVRDPRSGLWDCHGASRVLDDETPPAPLVVVRRPSAATAPLARTVAAGIDFAYFERTDAIAAVSGILADHLGVAP